MKEQTVIQKFSEAKNERLQNNRMIGELSASVVELQNLVIGLIKVTRALSEYDDIVAKLKVEAEQAEGVNLDLGKDEEE
jgi:hypothetical protein